MSALRVVNAGACGSAPSLTTSSCERRAAITVSPISSQLRTLNNLREVTSYTANEYSRVVAEFDYDADLVTALDQVKQRVENLRSLPPVHNNTGDSVRPVQVAAR